MSQFPHSKREVVGRSGRHYVLHEKPLKFDPEHPEFFVCRASSNGFQFIAKRVPKSFLDIAERYHRVFSGSSSLRLPSDYSDEHMICFYAFVKDDVLSFFQKCRDSLSVKTIMCILFKMGQAIQTCHGKDYLHLDVKPDNFFIDSHLDEEKKEFVVEALCLGDEFCSVNLKGNAAIYPREEFKDFRAGNIMWRSPEGQTGQGLGKFSDVFSYGLVCIWALTGRISLNFDFSGFAQNYDNTPEQIALGFSIAFFGPLESDFIEHIRDREWQEHLVKLAPGVKDEAEVDEVNFAHWTHPLLKPPIHELISKMVKFTPQERLTIEQVLEQSVWDDVREL